MSESLKEKAKTLMQDLKTIFKTSGLGTRNLLFKNVFEYYRNASKDAQQDKENELSKQQEAFQKQVGYLKEDIKKLERERGLLKQKPREFWKWLEQKAWRGVSSEVIDEFGERFEELLK